MTWFKQSTNAWQGATVMEFWSPTFPTSCVCLNSHTPLFFYPDVLYWGCLMTYTREKERLSILCGVQAWGNPLGSMTVKKAKVVARYCSSNATKHDFLLIHHSPSTRGLWPKSFSCFVWDCNKHFEGLHFFPVRCFHILSVSGGVMAMTSARLFSYHSEWNIVHWKAFSINVILSF